MRIHLMLATALFVVASSVQAQISQPPPVREPGAGLHGNAELGWYASSNEYKYFADVNLNFDFGKWGPARFTFAGGILTLIKSTADRSFRPDRYRGTVEPAVYYSNGPVNYRLGLRHQSFHGIDRVPPFKESYELLYLGYERIGKPNFTLTAGPYLGTDDVDYTWDFLVRFDMACIGMCHYGPIYWSAVGHYVTEDESFINTDRSGFFDYSLEVGLQTSSGVIYFTGYSQIHDINQFKGVTESAWLIGAKYLW